MRTDFCILSIGAGNLTAVQDDELELVQLGLLASDLVKADLLSYLSRKVDLLWRVPLRSWVPGILELEGREEGLRRICWAGRADEGCGGQ